MTDTFQFTREVSMLEPVANLWAYADETGYFRHIAGKVYCLSGAEEKKLSILRELSKTDFLTTSRRPVPNSCVVIDGSGNRASGVAHADLIHVPSAYLAVFGGLIESFAEQLPPQAHMVSGRHRSLRIELPNRLLTVTTVVLLTKDGKFFPLGIQFPSYPVRAYE